MATLAYRIRKRIERAALPLLLGPSSRPDMRRLGSHYGGYYIPLSLLSSESIYYSAGVGEDITFDLGLIDATGCQVFALDPTPRSIEFVRREAANQPRFHFQPLGLWHEEATLRFYAPQDPRHVSHSILNLQGTDDYFEAACKTLSSIMAELGHDHLDLLKLNIEGAQYAVLDSIVENRVPVKVLAIAIDQPTSPVKVFKTVRGLQRAGYSLVKVDGWTYTFVNESSP